MKRDIIIHRPNSEYLAEALVSPKRLNKMDACFHDCLKRGLKLGEIIIEMNESGEWNDNEWTSFMFSLGYYCGKRPK